MTRTRLIFGAATACLTAPAHAQLVEISVDARDEVLGAAHAVIVFDTSSAPIDGNATTVTFEAYDASLSVDFPDFYLHNPGLAEVGDLRKASSATILYSTQEREILIRVEAPHCSLELEIESPVGPFHPYMTTLPTSPAAYLFDGQETQRVRVGFAEQSDESPARTGEALWRPLDGFTGAVTYTVRSLPEPEPQGCTEADLAPPFGLLDFDDVLAFINSFNADCP